MRQVSLIVVALTLLLVGAGCASHSQQGSVSTSAKDWKKVPPPADYLAMMRSHPPGPPAVHGSPPPGAAVNTPKAPAGPAAIH